MRPDRCPVTHSMPLSASLNCQGAPSSDGRKAYTVLSTPAGVDGSLMLTLGPRRSGPARATRQRRQSNRGPGSGPGNGDTAPYIYRMRALLILALFALLALAVWFA